MERERERERRREGDRTEDRISINRYLTVFHFICMQMYLAMYMYVCRQTHLYDLFVHVEVVQACSKINMQCIPLVPLQRRLLLMEGQGSTHGSGLRFTAYSLLKGP